MPLLELPHTPNCLVCGRSNPRGLQLALHVDEATGVVTTRLIPTTAHVGFEGIIHGGLIATVLDEAMVWAATWHAKRFCLAGELTVRFRESASAGQELLVTATVELARSKLIATTAQVRRASDDTLIATATGKYIPLSEDRHRAFIATFVPDPATTQSAAALRAP
ncbi:MAG TPA: PaaI family thioesterase [Tepidisphaeraceae bacterium]|jgi:acyl-coenzyme A thioesterase PaaI-like protein